MYKLPIKHYIPNGLSILNLISGTLGIIATYHDHLVYAAYGIFIGAFFDFLDGFFAKLLHVTSPLGKQLDTLADLVTFGVLPSMLLYKLMHTYEAATYGTYSVLGMVVCAAWRLATFNVDPRQSDQFIGLPTPASAILVATLPIILESAGNPYWVYGLTRPFALPLLTIFLSYLLVSNIPCMAWKFKNFSWKANRCRYFLLGLCITLIGVMRIEGIFLSVWVYIFYALAIPKY